MPFIKLRIQQRSRTAAKAPVRLVMSSETKSIDNAKQIRAQQGIVKFPFNNLPYEHNACFTGRDDEIKKIHDNFHNGIRIQTIYGMSGTGKTQIASEYAHCFAEEYDVVWWIDAETPATMYTAINLFLQSEKCLTETGSSEVDRGMFLSWFDKHDSWLLIYDNATYTTSEECEILQKHLPKNSAIGNVLLTTSCNTPYFGEPMISVKSFSESEAVDFLQRRTKKCVDENASALVQNLGCLPLALEQAGAFISEKLNGDYEAYLKLWLKYGIATFDSTDKARNHKSTVTSTLRITMDKLQIPGAIEIINLCAYLSPDGIDTALFYAYACMGEENLLSKATVDHIADELMLGQIIDALTKYSLCTCEPTVYRFDTRHVHYKHFRNIKRFHFHRLVQDVIRERIGNDLHYLYACIDMLCCAQRTIGMVEHHGDFTSNCIAVLEHIEQMNPIIEDHGTLRKLVLLSSQVASRLQSDDPAKGFWAAQKQISYTECIYGCNHEETADAMFSCGHSYFKNYYEQCMKHISNALKIREDNQSENLGEAYYTAALICYVQQDINRAVNYYEKLRALHIVSPDKCRVSSICIEDLASDIEDLRKWHKKTAED